MLWVILLALAACCSNVVFLEVLVRADPGCTNVITFFQFLFIAVEGFVFNSKFGTVRPVVPLGKYLTLVIMFFAVSVSNNYSLSYDISMPLHMIFKSGSLITSMLLGMIIFKRRYTLKKYVSVVMITVGIFIATWASQTLKISKTDKVIDTNYSTSDSLIGVFLLSFALFVSAGLGIYQEFLYKQYGKHAREALFYSHALPLPFFLLLAKDISAHIPVLTSSYPIEMPLIGSVPKLCLFLLGNVFTQYLCVRSVFKISSTYTSLTVTMFLTLRKFISLIFSIFYFQNPFTATHWFGTVLVFTGTAIFTDLVRFTKPSKQKRS